jgi:hypothetical protein
MERKSWRHMKPFIICMTDDGDLLNVTVGADSREAAEKFAKNYFGDVGTDYRNHNKVTFLDAVEGHPYYSMFKFQVGQA